MPVFFLYLIKLSLSLAMVYVFYMLVLRRLTFYRWNRLYLLVYPLSCFLIPFIDVEPLLQQARVQPAIIDYVPLVQNMVQPVTQERLPVMWVAATIVFLTGFIILVCRLLLQYYALRQIKRQSVLLSNDGVKLYQVNKDIMPFSFASAIYINQHNHTTDELKDIIRHEYVHVKQQHSLDILLAELLCIVNWYNPIVWLLRNAIRQNLEFIADSSVLESGIDKKAYQYLLLKVVGTPHFRIVNQFNFSSLKKRIVMMNKMKTTRVHLVKFVFILPLAAILLLAFRERITGFHPSQPIVQGGAVTDTVPETNQAAAIVAVDGHTAEKAFLKRHKKVKRIAWAYLHESKGATGKLAEIMQPGPVLLIYFTNGKFESYYLGSAREVKRFKNNYGEMPPMMPPPPPPPLAETPNAASVPAVPDAPVSVTVPEVPAMPDVPATALSSTVPLPPATPIAPAAPSAPVFPANVQSVHINNAHITVTLKDGTIEKYNMSDAKDKMKYEKKYGKLPTPPVPPPAPLYPAAEKQQEAAARYSEQLILAKQANAQHTIHLQRLQTMNEAKVAHLAGLRALNAQTSLLDAHKKYLLQLHQLQLTAKPQL